MSHLDICHNMPGVRIPNGTKVPVESIGRVTLGSKLTLANVLCVPQFECNLVSISKLTNEHNCAVIFFSDFFVVQYLSTRSLIGQGKLRDGIYYQRDYVSRPRLVMAAERAVVSSETWHSDVTLFHAFLSYFLPMYAPCLSPLCLGLYAF
ncbi:hypothetical protein LINPERHAP2_LOCUS42288 [Linum perenne]